MLAGNGLIRLIHGGARCRDPFEHGNKRLGCKKDKMSLAMQFIQLVTVHSASSDAFFFPLTF